jgi:hypothetical protein
MSHCDGQDGPGAVGGRARRDADGREPGMSADAGARRATTPQAQVVWHVSRTVAMPHRFPGLPPSDSRDRRDKGRDRDRRTGGGFPDHGRPAAERVRPHPKPTAHRERI